MVVISPTGLPSDRAVHVLTLRCPSNYVCKITNAGFDTHGPPRVLLMAAELSRPSRLHWSACRLQLAISIDCQMAAARFERGGSLARHPYQAPDPKPDEGFAAEGAAFVRKLSG